METNHIFNELANDYWLTDYISFGFTNYVRKKSLLYLDIKENDIVCDAMCGTGNNFKLLSQKKCDIIAIDKSSKMIAIAQQNTQSKKYKIVQDDFFYNQFEDEKFNKIICTFGLKTLSKNEIILMVNQLDRILKSNGKFVISDIMIDKNSIIGAITILYIHYILPILNLFVTAKSTHKYLFQFIKRPINIDFILTEFKHCNFNVTIKKCAFNQAVIFVGQKK